MSRLVALYARVVNVIFTSAPVPISRYEHYVNELSLAAMTFPEWLQNTEFSQLRDMSDRRRVCLVSLLPDVEESR